MHFLLKILAPVIVFALAFSLRIWNLGDMGRAWDEQFIAEDGYQFVQLAMKGDFTNDFWWTRNPDHPVLVRYIHGIASQFDFKGLDKTGYPILDYDLKFNKLISIFLTSATAVLVYLVGKRFYSKFVGIIAGIIFSMLPILLGHSQIGLYEPFIVFFFTLNCFLFLLFLENPTLRKAIIIGILSGIAIQAKETNLLLYPLYLLTYFIQHINSKKSFPPRKVIFLIIVIWIIGIISFFAIWPWAMIHLKEMTAYISARRFDTGLSIPEVFFGKLILTPRIYYVIMFLITTPLLILVLFFKGLLKINKSKNWIFYSFILWFVFPFIQSFYPNRQHGIRYIIEIYAPLSLIAAIGFDSLVNRYSQSKKILSFIPIFIYLFVILISLKPYYLDYFNEVVGGVNNVYEKKLFQYGYWGHGIKESLQYISRDAAKDSTVGIVLSPIHIVPIVDGIHSEKFNKNKYYDYILVHYYNIIREGFRIEQQISNQYKLNHTVTVDKAALVYIYKRKD